MLFDQNRVDAIIHNWKNQVFSNERIHGVPLRHSTCLKPPIGGFRNFASSFFFRFLFCLILPGTPLHEMRNTAYRPGDYTCGVPSTVTGYASCHSLSPENATHLAGTGMQVLIYMGQMRLASSSVGGSVDARLDRHTDYHLQQKRV